MRIANIQSNNNTHFNAKLKLTGYIDDISQETKELWQNRAQKIGTDRDLITLHFGSLMRERGPISFINGKWQEHIASLRAIYASANINNVPKYNNLYIGYRVSDKPHSSEIRDKNVSNFFNRLA